MLAMLAVATHVEHVYCCVDMRAVQHLVAPTAGITPFLQAIAGTNSGLERPKKVSVHLRARELLPIATPKVPAVKVGVCFVLHCSDLILRVSLYIV